LYAEVTFSFCLEQRCPTTEDTVCPTFFISRANIGGKKYGSQIFAAKSLWWANKFNTKNYFEQKKLQLIP